MDMINKSKVRRRAAWAGRGLGQVLFFMATWMVADVAARHCGSQIPGAVWGLGALVALLWSGVLPAAFVEVGARWLLAEMLLFFVPLCVAIADYPGLFAKEGARLVAAVVVGTVMVMAGAAWVVDVVYRWETRWNAARARKEAVYDR